MGKHVQEQSLKTINNETLIGDGNITIETDIKDLKIASGNSNATFNGSKSVNVNLKTINNQSLLGMGDIDTTIDLASTSKDGLMSKDDKSKLNSIKSFASEDRIKLDGIEENATKNETDEFLLDRANHAGVQAIETIDGLVDALDNKVDNSRVLTDVPLDAIFTDTIYDDTPIVARVEDLENTEYITADNTYNKSEVDTMLSDIYTKREVDMLIALGSLDETDLKWVTYDSVQDIYSGNPGVTPVHEAMRRCVVDSDCNVVYYLDEYDSTKKEDGTPANLDGTDGNVMVEIPQVWYKTEFLGDRRTDYISHEPRDGFALHPRFRDGAVEKIYVGAYDASVFSVSSDEYIDGLNLDNNSSRVDTAVDRLASVSGRFPMVGLTRAQFRSLATNASGFLEQWYERELLKMLFLVEYGNWDSQIVLGRGNVDNGSYPNSSDDQTRSPHVAAGWSNGLGNQSGGINMSSGTPYVSYRGIENLWGNCCTFNDGVNILDRQLYVSADPSVFADDTTTEYVIMGSPMPTASGSYIKSWQSVDGVFIPDTVGGSSSTFIPDGLWTATGWRVMVSGGAATNALLSGLCMFYGSDAATARNRYRGSRLSLEKLAT